MTTPVLCSACPNILGMRQPDGRIEVRHRGRRLIGHVDEIVCERCKEVWRAVRNAAGDTLTGVRETMTT